MRRPRGVTVIVWAIGGLFDETGFRPILGDRIGAIVDWPSSIELYRVSGPCLMTESKELERELPFCSKKDRPVLEITELGIEVSLMEGPRSAVGAACSASICGSVGGDGSWSCLVGISATVPPI